MSADLDRLFLNLRRRGWTSDDPNVVPQQEITTGSGNPQPAGWSMAYSSSLDRLPGTLHTTYGDDFDASSLNARWSRHNLVPANESFQVGPAATHMRVSYPSTVADYCHYQAGPAGDWTVELAGSWWQDQPSGMMWGLLAVNTAGTGVGMLVYDTANYVFLGNITTWGYGSILTNGYYTSLDYRGGERYWLRLRKAGTTYYGSFSVNGRTYSPEISGAWAGTFASWAFGRVVGNLGNEALDIDWFDKTA